MVSKSINKKQYAMNKQTRIYCTNVRVKFKKSHESYDEFSCGDIYAFVKSEDAGKALIKFRKELKIQNLKPISFEFISPFEDMDWEDKDIETKFQQLADEASKTDEVVFDNLYSESRNE
jgi:hypothetical protein